MAKPWKGMVEIHASKKTGNVFLAEGGADATLTANDADNILRLSMEAAEKYKMNFNRWSFYILHVNEALRASGEPITLKHVKAALAAGMKPRVVEKFKKPAIHLLPVDAEPKKRESNIIKIA